MTTPISERLRSHSLLAQAGGYGELYDTATQAADTIDALVEALAVCLNVIRVQNYTTSSEEEFEEIFAAEFGALRLARGEEK